MSFKIIICTLLLGCTVLLSAQTEHQNAGHDEDHNPHHDHKNEIGIANALVYFVKEKSTAYGLHLHYIHNIGESDFGIGLGFERIFDDHGHNTFGLVGSYRPIDPLSFILSPGITFEDGDSEHVNFALHIETSYEFAIGNIHIGPVLEMAYDPEDIHLSIGIHLGYGF